MSPRSSFIAPLPHDDLRWIAPDDLGAPTLLLRRVGPLSGPPVLLVHGLSAQSNTFEISERPGGGLARWLCARGFTVWLLDYRGSSHPAVLQRLQALPSATTRAGFRFGATARHDIARAVREIARCHPTHPGVSVVAHCIGAGLTALALAVEPDLPIDRLVLSTLGLFYRAPFIRDVKVWSMIAEYFAPLTHDPWLRPWFDWSQGGEAYRLLHDAERAWVGLRFGQVELAPDGPPWFVRLSFLFGEPYRPARIPALHADEATLRAAFGPINRGVLEDVANNQRAGRPTTDCLDAAAGGAAPTDPQGEPLDPRPFLDRTVTLLTGRYNRLWHPSSITTMHGWLRDRGADPDRLHQWVLPTYGHQDLLWAASAADDVFPLIERALPDR